MKRLCSQCNKRPAKFLRHGKVKSDRGHNMCLQCFRSLSERNAQLILNGQPAFVIQPKYEPEERRRFMLQRDIVLMFENHARETKSYIARHFDGHSDLARRLKIIVDNAKRKVVQTSCIGA